MLTQKKLNKIQNYYFHDSNFFKLCNAEFHGANFSQLSFQYPDLNLKLNEFYSFIAGLTNRPKFGFLRGFHDFGLKIRGLMVNIKDVKYANYYFQAEQIQENIIKGQIAPEEVDYLIQYGVPKESVNSWKENFKTKI